MNGNRFFRTASNIFYLTRFLLPELQPTVAPEVTEHMFVVDRSGSMYSDIDPLKSTMEQVLGVESYINQNVLTTLISFSSHGDVTLHWSGVPANKVTELSGPYLPKLRSIRATSLTGISQALNLALERVDKSRTTGITLFTDGYANDPSSALENKALEKFVERVRAEFPNVFVNCIGFRDWCDWPRMNQIANALSGKCTKASSFKDVLEAMKDTQALLSGRAIPAITVPGVAGQLSLAVNRTTGQVNVGVSGEDMVIRGVGADANLEIYTVQVADKASTVPKGVKVIGDGDEFLSGALALAYLSLGSLRTSKEILFASGNKTLWAEHQAAMTPSSLAEMISSLQKWVVAGTNDAYEMGRNTRPQHNLFDLANAINALPPKSIGIDLDAFMKGYRRRSIKKISGTRNEDGTITQPLAKTVPREGSRTYVRGISFNTADASVQVETERAVWVQRLSDDKTFQEVEFVSLEGLRDYRSFTLISSGERNVEILPIEVYTKDAWAAISPFILPSEAREFSPGQKAKISLKRFRMEAEEYPTEEVLLNSVFARLEATAEVKIFSAMQDKEAASPYTAEQIAALKGLHLSPALYFSAPSTVHYTDKDEAVRLGQIDSFTRYKINFGNLNILSTDEFRSGNAFVQRRYAVTDASGAKLDKPTLPGYQKGDKYTVKPPGKAKDTPADCLMAQVADAVLLSDTRLNNDEITKRLKKAKMVVDVANQILQGLVMEIGCTGLIPRDLETSMTRYEPEALEAKFGIKLGKAEKEGMFWVSENGLVISVTPETSWYTVKTSTESDVEIDA
jgi:hypothetical protein